MNPKPKSMVVQVPGSGTALGVMTGGVTIGGVGVAVGGTIRPGGEKRIPGGRGVCSTSGGMGIAPMLAIVTGIGGATMSISLSGGPGGRIAGITTLGSARS